MTTNSKEVSTFSEVMRYLIRAIAELSIKEGYTISSVQSAIYSEIISLIPDNQSFEFENPELEEKLITLFDEKIPEWMKDGNERLLAVCEAYYTAREKSPKVKLADLAVIIAKKFSLKESSAKYEINAAGYRINNWIFQEAKTSGIGTKAVLEKFYLTYMK